MAKIQRLTGQSANLGAEEVDAIRLELRTITQSDVFKRSRRSQEFLEYTVGKALDGRMDELKERVIGCALLGRANDYDTGADSIVRVVANETRRRLQQYYHENGERSAIRIDLLSGTYVPSIHRVEKTLPAAELQPPAAAPLRPRPPFSIAWGAILVLATICAFLLFQNRQLRLQQRTEKAAPIGLPWSALFHGNRGIHILLADTSVGGIQNFLQTHLSLTDYLNRKFVPEPGKLDARTLGFMRFLGENQYTSASYATTAIRIAQVAQANGAPVSVSFAREMSLRTFKGGENFVVLGSSRANPWAQLFEPLLNFTLEYGGALRSPLVRNRQPRPSESATYVDAPEPGSALYVSYGHMAFLPSVFQGGSILFVSGTGSQATEATGEFLTDAVRLGAELAKFGIRPNGPPVRFEVLLRVRHTTGAPVRSEVVALR
jgi:hypothetical protein